MKETINILRLKRSELHSSAYQSLIKSLFVKGQVDERLRYAKWIFEENPALRNDERLPIYICRVNDSDAGQIAIIPVEVLLAGELIRGGWAVDFYVKPEFQRRGIGEKLMTAAYQDFPLLMTLGQTEASFNLLVSKFNWHYNDNRAIYYKAFLHTFLLLKFFAKKMGLLKQRQLEAMRIKRLKPPSESPLKEFESFAEIADFVKLQEMKKKDSTTIVRSLKFLEWRYTHHPFIKYNMHYIEVFNSYNVYIVWRIVHDGFWYCARIVHVLYNEDVPISAMKNAFKIFMKFVSSCGAEIIECQTNDAFVLQALPNSLCSSKSLDKRFLYGMIDMTKCPLVPNDHWKLYSGDCDVETLSFGD